MLAGGRRFLPDATWLMVFPGLAVSLTVLGFNLLGDGLRDALGEAAPEQVAVRSNLNAVSLPIVALAWLPYGPAGAIWR